ncbi:hypothetical protein BU107_04495 [Staphylococcus xylosus]|uniref:hypothetical protein n=1 Tax=Staphylococcus xylosus TaxID=1288 RepID=UPI000E686B0F|nr:hypothetical protein [Staphylococcus xylosus]RIM88988.1 hypothetical protein BU107_04495 [Staphylococcus xylosus]
MNRVAGIKFIDEAGLGKGIGYLTFVTGVIDQEQYELNYCAERPMHERFVLFTEEQTINLSHYLSKWDLERLNQAYFEFRTTNTPIAYLTVQLQDCYELCVDVLAS